MALNPESDSHTRYSVVYRVSVVGFAVVLVFAYAYSSQQIFNPDPCVLGEGGQLLLKGGCLYADVWEDKAPLAMLAYALPQIFAPGSMAGLQVFLALILISAGTFAARQIRSTSGKCLVFSITTLLPLSHIDLLWLSTEHLANLCVLVVLMCIVKEHRDKVFLVYFPVIAGVAVACAFHVRQTTVVVGILYAVCVLAGTTTLNHRLRRLVVFVSSGLLTWLLFIVAMVTWGDLHGYLYTVFLYPGRYAGIGSWTAAGKLLAESAQTPIPFVTALLLAITWNTPYRKLAVITLSTGLIICVLPRRTAVHYLSSIFPFLVLLVWLTDGYRAKLERTLRVVAVGVVAIGSLSAAMTLWRIADAPSARWMDSVVKRVVEIAGRESTLWVAGPKVSTYIQFAAPNPPANTYWVAFRLDPPQVEVLPKSRATIMAEYLEQPPEVLVVYGELLTKTLAAKPIRKPPAEIRNSEELLSNLLLSNRYRRRETVAGFVILTLL